MLLGPEKKGMGNRFFSLPLFDRHVVSHGCRSWVAVRTQHPSHVFVWDAQAGMCWRCLSPLRRSVCAIPFEDHLYDFWDVQEGMWWCYL